MVDRAVFGIPDDDGVVFAGAGQAVAGGVERDVVDGLGVPVRRTFVQTLAGRRVPELNRTVLAADGDQCSGVVPGRGPRPGPERKCLRRPEWVDVPDDRRLVVGGAHQLGSIGAVLERYDGGGVLIGGRDFSSGGHIPHDYPAVPVAAGYEPAVRAQGNGPSAEVTHRPGEHHTRITRVDHLDAGALSGHGNALTVL